MAAGDIIQSKTGWVYNTAGNLVVTLDNDFTPGNSLVIILSWQHYLKGHADSLIQSITDNKSHTFTKRTGIHRIPEAGYAATGDLWSEIWDCLDAADASPGTHITITADPKRTEANNHGYLYVAEVEGLAAFKEVALQTGGGTSSASVTSTTPTLSPVPQIAFSGFATFASGVGTPAGWDVLATSVAGTPLPHGFGAAKRMITDTVAAQAVWTYATSTPGAAATIATYLLESPALRAKFLVRDDLFTDADTDIEGVVWWGDPADGVDYDFFTGLAGDSTPGALYITSGLPGGLAAGQPIQGVFNSTTDTTGRISGVVEEL